ncbi:conserved protein, unknown function [Hepatocystis sp. ex Piliocolobus tephrosceles]|nr:conserved protein, unknown function [Hepatocystis sp. ex Piliocolobus tephrosceles]
MERDKSKGETKKVNVINNVNKVKDVKNNTEFNTKESPPRKSRMFNNNFDNININLDPRQWFNDNIKNNKMLEALKKMNIKKKYKFIFTSYEKKKEDVSKKYDINKYSYVLYNFLLFFFITFDFFYEIIKVIIKNVINIYTIPIQLKNMVASSITNTITLFISNINIYKKNIHSFLSIIIKEKKNIPKVIKNLFFLCIQFSYTYLSKYIEPLYRYINTKYENIVKSKFFNVFT